MADAKIKATVTVMKREGFQGFWSAQRFFPHGLSTVELTAEEFKVVQADADLGLPIAIVENSPKK